MVLQVQEPIHQLRTSLFSSVFLFLGFLEKFIYLSLTLNFWLHQMSPINNWSKSWISCSGLCQKCKQTTIRHISSNTMMSQFRKRKKEVELEAKMVVQDGSCRSRGIFSFLFLFLFFISFLFCFCYFFFFPFFFKNNQAGKQAFF